MRKKYPDKRSEKDGILFSYTELHRSIPQNNSKTYTKLNVEMFSYLPFSSVISGIFSNRLESFPGPQLSTHLYIHRQKKDFPVMY